MNGGNSYGLYALDHGNLCMQHLSLTFYVNRRERPRAIDWFPETRPSLLGVP